jgi:hypothetical protein
MFLERAQEAAGIHAENWKLFPQVMNPAEVYVREEGSWT